MYEWFDIVLQIVFFASVSAFLSSVIGILSMISAADETLGGIDEGGQRNRRKFYDLLRHQSYYFVSACLAGSLLTHFTEQAGDAQPMWLTGITSTFLYIGLIIQTFVLFIHSGYDGMLCNVQVPQRSDKTKLRNIKLNYENYDRIFKEKPRTFFHSSKKRGSDSYSTVVDSIFSNFRKRRNINAELSKDDLRSAIARAVDNGDESKINQFRLTENEKKKLFQQYIISKNYFDNEDELNVDELFVSKTDIDDAEKMISEIDGSREREPSDSLLLRKGLFGGSLLSILAILDSRYDHEKKIDDDDKNINFSNQMLAIYALQLPVFVFSFLGGPQSMLAIYMNARSSYDEESRSGVQRSDIDEFERKFRKADGPPEIYSKLSLRDFYKWFDSGGSTSAMRRIIRKMNN